ncbi:NAD(P)H dehydrogenase [Hydrogenoanaerobacterium sp.]|uniref:NAD(P)H dehydrogenase n=1 Tax=Hydrogenoanaerobacterium sp. TaxID=2953763 RepID=UPI00289FBEC3|nr:NAD(P)H dehydrogenase [Hydrogenoanaerobacterium sp.]
MNTIILNGSPKLNPKMSNTQFLAEEFIKDIKNPVEIKRISDCDPDELAEYIKRYDNVIILFPLYIHAMPGPVASFLEKLKPAEQGKNLGFIIQSGFPDTHHHQYVTPYLKRLAERLNCNYLGAVCKGECAAIYQFPDGFKKTIDMFYRLGKEFDKTNAFDEKIVKEMAVPDTFSKKQLIFLNIAGKLKLTNIFWNSEMKKNKCLDKALDRPYL